MSVLRPDLMMKCVVPVIMAGIIAVSLLTCRFSSPTGRMIVNYVSTADNPSYVDLRLGSFCPYCR